MPMVGIRNSRVICAASSRGTASENDSEGASGFDGVGVAKKLFGGVGTFALDAVTAKGVDGLGREADVSHNGFFRLSEAGDELKTALAVFDFTASAPASLMMRTALRRASEMSEL